MVVENEVRASFKLLRYCSNNNTETRTTCGSHQTLLFLLRVIPKKVNPAKLDAVVAHPGAPDIAQDMLRSDTSASVIILDCQTEIYIWHKKDAPDAHLVFAREYVMVMWPKFNVFTNAVVNTPASLPRL